MSERLLISVDPATVRAVRAEGGRAEDYRCVRADGGGENAGQVGDILLGRAGRAAAEPGGAFVECGLPRAGFLAAADAPADSGGTTRGWREARALTVQIVAEALPGKGPRVSARPRFAGRYAVYLPDARGVSVSRRVAGAQLRARLRAAGARALERRPGGALGGVIVRAAAAAFPEGVARDLDRLAAAAAAVERAAAASAPPRLLRREAGAVERILRDFAPAGAGAIIIDDGAAFRRAVAYAESFAPDLAGRIARRRGAEPLFEAEGVADDIEALVEERVALRGGGALTIQRAEAMWAIDVDSAGRAGPVLRLNLAAAEEIARQLRLRDISGLVAIDFPAMTAADTTQSGSRPGAQSGGRAVVRALRRAAARDAAPVRIAPMSRFGVVELSRRRAAAPLDGLLAEPCPACGGAGRRKTAFAVACEIVRACLARAAAQPGRAVAVRAAPDAIAALEGPLAAAVRAACAATFRADRACPRDRFELLPGDAA